MEFRRVLFRSGCAFTGTPAISADGGFVAFHSAASILVPGDANGKLDVFVHDRATGTKERVSVDSAGAEGNDSSWVPAISGDGRFVAFESWATNLVLGDGDTYSFRDVFLRDRLSGATERVSVSIEGDEPNAESLGPAISADGRFVAFSSSASNLVPGDFGYPDIFVRDRQTGVTTMVSVDSAGNKAGGHSYSPAISADGRFVTFSST